MASAVNTNFATCTCCVHLPAPHDRDRSSPQLRLNRDEQRDGRAVTRLDTKATSLHSQRSSVDSWLAWMLHFPGVELWKATIPGQGGIGATLNTNISSHARRSTRIYCYCMESRLYPSTLRMGKTSAVAMVLWCYELSHIIPCFKKMMKSLSALNHCPQ
jgi:hypothetical protein